MLFKPKALVLHLIINRGGWSRSSGVEPAAQQLNDIVVLVAPTSEPNTVRLDPKRLGDANSRWRRSAEVNSEYERCSQSSTCQATRCSVV